MQNFGPKYVYENIEKPLLPILTEMERRGVLVDTNQLGQLSQEFATRMATHENRIFELAGEQFNVNSPKQLGEILFDKLKLDLGKKKKRSTNVEVMELLAEQGHDIANEVLAYRSVAKLRSTYTEALSQQVNPKTGRVHTSYNAVGAATGRMSSSDPNLQNIPIRTEDGRKIRHAFIAPQGWQLMSADYSQIELRLLAHFSKSKGLQEAFLQGVDVHAFTASRVFNVELPDVTSDQRRIAKAVNFGLVYGMGATSLAKQIGTTRVEAQEYIGRYFTRYDGVKDYMEANKQFCRDHGYVETLFGRRIHLPTIHSNNGGLRAGAERAAINAPLQGSNADIIKLAMPKIEQALQQGGYKTRMLMQVHDELVFEVPQEEVKKVQPLITNLMENAVKLEVPLKVEAGLGTNWEDAH
ncbi:MAG: DNA polymerase I [Alphaproteobacteria bacterium]|nr:DNA polymerase I [Alphaproteobacteria bacterium]MDD9919231.1 DNA polymerase I [Alphaproteobacteria bacterium]